MATLEQVMTALRNADAAGDATAARRLAQIAQTMRGSQQAPVVDGPVTPPSLPEDAQAGYLAPASGPQPNTFGNVVSDVIEEPWSATKAYAAGLVDQSQSPTLKSMPEDWNPALKRLYAYGGDAAMAGLSVLGTAYAGAAGTAAELIAGDTTQEQRLAGDLMAAGQVAVPELAGVSSVNRAAASAASAATKAERLAQSPTPKQAAARAADDLGITPSLGMTGKTGAMTAAGLEKVPLSGSVVARDAARAVGEVEGAYSRILGRLGQAKAPYEAGDVLQSGLKDFVGRFKERSNVLFGEVGRKIPAGTKVRADSAVSAIEDAKAAFAENPELAKKLGLNNWDAVAAEIKSGGISWDALKQFRTDVGEALGTPSSALSDTSKGRLKQLYAALTEDMEAAAKAAGPDAYKAWKRANTYYRTGAQRIERSLDKTITAQSPERAFEAFSALTKADRSTADITRMRQIKASLSRDDWNDVSASIVDRLGRAKPGAQNAMGDAFSPGAFLTEWNKLSPEGKRILLPEDVRVELEKLATVAESVKNANAERNFSNTGTAAGLLATGAGGVANLPATVGALLTANISARGLTNVSFLRAINRAQRGDTKALQAMSRGNGGVARDAATVLRLMAAETAQSANTDRQPTRALSQ